MSLILVFIILFSIILNRVALAEPLVRIEASRVTYQGILKNGIEHFQNIKYAHDTSGQRRFAPPELYVPPQDSVIDATAPGPGCPQVQDAMLPFFSRTDEMSEDCLSLRISRPATSGDVSEGNFPVVVWVHGGGVVKGSAYDPHSDPEKLLQLSISIGKPVIYVAINYRLTIFGFARLPILKDQKSLNVGMRDQRAAFEWVKNNIRAFGGDPDRITGYGLSAGATFTSLHLMSYGGERGVPFTQAWLMSGPPGTALNMTTDATEIHTRAVAQQLDCLSNNEDELLGCLREVPMEKLLDIALTYSVANHPPAGLFTFIPSVDDDLLPARQSILYKSGRFVKGIPLVFGWTQDDGAMNVGPAHLIQSEEDMIPVIRNFARALTSGQLSTLFSLYLSKAFEVNVSNYEARKDDSEPTVSVHYFRVAQILRDMLFTCLAIEFGTEMAKQSRAINPNFPGVRLYDLNQSMLTPLWKGAGMPYVRVSHGSDTNYIFNGLFPEREVSETDRVLSEAFSKSFLNFAYTGNPTSATDDGFSEWAEIMSANGDLNTTAPLRTNILVIGGPHGTGFVSVSGTDEDHIVGNEGSQQVLHEGFEFEEMKSSSSGSRRPEMERENLLQRCAYINNLSETLGN